VSRRIDFALRLRPDSAFDVVAIETDHAESLLEAISERRP
jgi:hypothetical protein